MLLSDGRVCGLQKFNLLNTPHFPVKDNKRLNFTNSCLHPFDVFAFFIITEAEKPLDRCSARTFGSLSANTP